MSGAAAGRGEPTLESMVVQTLGALGAQEREALIPPLVGDLEAINERLHEVLRSTYPPLTDSATYACATGGKQLRPLLMAVLYRALGAESTQPIHSLAAAFQLIHTATLVHDDVIDHAALRRGRPSLPRAFGLPAAIVTGDFLFVRAFELAGEYSRSVILRCGEACADLVEGELLQEANHFDLTTGREHYFRVVERKTAALVAASLASVAEIANQPTAVIDACAVYGRALGIAFQLRDDLLDVYGDADLLGKPLFTDFREGTPTLVSVEAYARLASDRREEYERLFADRRKKPGDLLRLRDLTDESGAPAAVNAELDRWVERARRSLDHLPRNAFTWLLEQVAHGMRSRPF
jgi:octaprenyl-diphosphate synthase